MSLDTFDSSFLSEIKNRRTIKSFEDLKSILSNEILIYLQFDLPKEFNLVDLSRLTYANRFMRNFSKTISYSKSVEIVKKNLTEYFKMELVTIDSDKHKKFTRELPKATFKQVFFDIGEKNENKIVIDDTTNLSLKEASENSLENAITGFELNDKSLRIDKEDQLESKIPSSSKTNNNSIFQIENIASDENSNNPEIMDLMKEFSININPQTSLQTGTKRPPTKEDRLNETFELLGIGNIKKNLGKTIITKKRKEGLFFDEWVKENLIWVQFLIKKLTHLDYLSLKDEAEFLSHVRKFKVPDVFEKELNQLYAKLGIDSNED